MNTDERERLLNAPPAVRTQVRFIPTLCPRCGWDMEGERDSLVLICRNCSSAWACPADAFTPVDFAVLAPPPETKEDRRLPPLLADETPGRGDGDCHLRRPDPHCEPPKAITPAFTATPLRFWSPAFKVNPALYLRWARQMTIFQPTGDEGNRLPPAPLYPVTLPLREAAEGIVITLASLITDKRSLYPRLSGQ